jgi:glycosyltransferase involved in cell wall biosynthesis
MTDKKHVLITNATVFEDIIGGAQKATDEIAVSLSQLGYSVTILVPDRLNDGVMDYMSQCKQYRISKYKSFNGLLKFLNIFSAILKFNKINSYEKIHILWGNSPEPWLFLPKKKIEKIIYTMHGPWLLERKLDNRTTFLAKILGPLLIKKNVKYHFQSNYVYQTCCKEIKKLKKVKYIISPLLINEDKIKNKSNTKNKKNKSILYQNKLNILLPRRLVNRTGVVEFLTIISNKRFSFLNVIVVGTGYLEEKVREIANNNKNIIFLGKVEQNQLNHLFQESDIVCMPSVDAEGFGVSILEAIFRNTPVVYTKGGGMEEFLSKVPECKHIDLNNVNNILSVFIDCYELKKTKNLAVNRKTIPYNFIDNLKALIDE